MAKRKKRASVHVSNRPSEVRTDMLQLVETWQEILQVLISIEVQISALVMIVFINLICSIATARNTQTTSKGVTTPKTPRKAPSLLAKLWRRLRPSDRDRLPEGDTKELVE